MPLPAAPADRRALLLGQRFGHEDVVPHRDDVRPHAGARSEREHVGGQRDPAGPDRAVGVVSVTPARVGGQRRAPGCSRGCGRPSCWHAARQAPGQLRPGARERSRRGRAGRLRKVGEWTSACTASRSRNSTVPPYAASSSGAARRSSTCQRRGRDVELPGALELRSRCRSATRSARCRRGSPRRAASSRCQLVGRTGRARCRTRGSATGGAEPAVAPGGGPADLPRLEQTTSRPGSASFASSAVHSPV